MVQARPGAGYNAGTSGVGLVCATRLGYLGVALPAAGPIVLVVLRIAIVIDVVIGIT
jgi:hypothetical protein